MGGYFQSANTAQAGYEAAGFGHGEAGNGWGFAEEMRQRMGDEFEPDAQFMEESWTLGLAAAAESWRARRHGGDGQRGSAGVCAGERVVCGDAAVGECRGFGDRRAAVG